MNRINSGIILQATHTNEAIVLRRACSIFRSGDSPPLPGQTLSLRDEMWIALKAKDSGDPPWKVTLHGLLTKPLETSVECNSVTTVEDRVTHNHLVSLVTYLTP